MFGPNMKTHGNSIDRDVFIVTSLPLKNTDCSCPLAWVLLNAEGEEVAHADGVVLG